MNNSTIKIPILSAAAFVTLFAAGCAQRSSDAETTALNESVTEQTKSSGKTSSAKTSTAKSTSKKAKETTAESTVPASETVTETAVSEKHTGLIGSPEELDIYDVNGNGTEYEFLYNGQFFEAEYTAEPENWKIIDSYKITDKSDMILICKALSDFHPIHGSDYESYRTPEDMAYEWEQHNLAFKLLPEGNSWRENAKDVDLDPEDQGKGIYELFKSRTGGSFF